MLVFVIMVTCVHDLFIDTTLYIVTFQCYIAALQKSYGNWLQIGAPHYIYFHPLQVKCDFYANDASNALWQTVWKRMYPTANCYMLCYYRTLWLSFLSFKICLFVGNNICIVYLVLVLLIRNVKIF